MVVEFRPVYAIRIVVLWDRFRLDPRIGGFDPGALLVIRRKSVCAQLVAKVIAQIPNVLVNLFGRSKLFLPVHCVMSRS